MLESPRMTKLLVKFYDAILKHKHYPNRWLDALDVMLEKGKGNMIKKLRSMQITEADLQLMMQMFLGLRVNEKIERDKRLSKHN